VKHHAGVPWNGTDGRFHAFPRLVDQEDLQFVSLLGVGSEKCSRGPGPEQNRERPGPHKIASAQLITLGHTAVTGQSVVCLMYGKYSGRPPRCLNQPGAVAGVLNTGTAWG